MPFPAPPSRPLLLLCLRPWLTGGEPPPHPLTTGVVWARQVGSVVFGYTHTGIAWHSPGIYAKRNQPLRCTASESPWKDIISVQYGFVIFNSRLSYVSTSIFYSTCSVRVSEKNKLLAVTSSQASKSPAALPFYTASESSAKQVTRSHLLVEDINKVKLDSCLRHGLEERDRFVTELRGVCE